MTHVTLKQIFLRLLSLSLFLSLVGCKNNETPAPELELTSLQLDNESLLNQTLEEAKLGGPLIGSFNQPLDTNDLQSKLFITDEDQNKVAIRLNVFNSNKSISIYPSTSFETYTLYTVSFRELSSEAGDQSFTSSGYQFRTIPGQLTLESITSGAIDLNVNKVNGKLPLDLQITATFSADLDVETVDKSSVTLKKGGRTFDLTTTVNGKELEITATEPLDYWTSYDLVIDESVGAVGAVNFGGFKQSFITDLDSTLKYPEISDEELLTKVQEQTFKYFWDFGHPVSGLARERNTSQETVTIGGSGFGVMAILVGIERGFVTHQEGIDRLDKIITFLGDDADRFHGVWSHWLNGTSGQVVPFSANDDGGDLVETAFMIQGLITVRQYLDASDPQEAEIIDKINDLVDEVEWDWYTQNDQDVLYWHWSPNFGWEKNHRITGWNEAMIVYVMAAASTTHSIDKEVYQSGWSRDGDMVNSGNTSHYGYTLPLRTDRGGPLFFAHYSFLGLDPRNLSDQFANYWTQNVTHSQINQAYCIANPQRYVGYTDYSWGLTASDGDSGYSAHSPNNDRGVITPTAALSSIPYTPEESIKAMRHFYFILGDRLWGEYGFYDAFNPTENWYASSYLAIDQGPIILMIENYRTGLLWDLFMSAPEVQSGLEKLEITYE